MALPVEAPSLQLVVFELLEIGARGYLIWITHAELVPLGIMHDRKALVLIADGGKLSFATFGVILGASLGGVGIAVMGGAFSFPLALVLGLGGLVAGVEVLSPRPSVA